MGNRIKDIRCWFNDQTDDCEEVRLVGELLSIAENMQSKVRRLEKENRFLKADCTIEEYVGQALQEQA